MAKTISVDAPAKLNLYLGVYPQLDERGYHRVDSIMVATSLKDRIVIEESDKLSVSCIPQVDFPEESNTAYKAALIMGEAFNKSVNYAITIYKNIPFKSGLGGASADCASVISGLCYLWDIDINSDKVLKIAQSIGADVAFFLFGKPMLLNGAGDVPCETFKDITDMHVVLVRPFGDGITAAQAYKSFDEEHEEAKDIEPIVNALRKGDNLAIAQNISNNLDPVACKLMPNLVDILNWLNAQDGVISSMVTGSGSCMYAICDSKSAALQIESLAKDKGLWSKACVVETAVPTIKQDN